MPSDFTNPGLLGDFLDWTVRDLCRSWSNGERAGSTCTLDFACMSRGIGARVIHDALPFDQ